MIEEMQKIEIPTRFIPGGAELIEAYKTKDEIIILGETDWVTEHNCDQMGCSTLTHVIYRFPIGGNND